MSLVDLYPTLCELCDLPLPERLDGTSLVPLLRDPEAPRERPAITVHLGDDRAGYAVRTDRWRYIRYHDGGEELYDHQRDEHEWHNLADDSQYADLKTQLAKWIPERFRSASRPVAEIRIERNGGRTRYHLVDGDELPAEHSPDLDGRSLSVSATLEPRCPDGVIVAQGAAQSGWAVYLSDGRPALVVNHRGQASSLIAEERPAGRFTLRVDVKPSGAATIIVNDQTVATGELGDSLPARPHQGLSVGHSTRVLDADLRIVGFQGVMENLVVEVGE